MEIKCPKCGSSKFSPELEQKGVYECINENADGTLCFTIAGAKCKQCACIYPINGFGKHGDVYECKECGQVNWPLTDRIREKEEYERKWKEIQDRAEAFSRMMSGEINR